MSGHGLRAPPTNDATTTEVIHTTASYPWLTAESLRAAHFPGPDCPTPESLGSAGACGGGRGALSRRDADGDHLIVVDHQDDARAQGDGASPGRAFDSRLMVADM